MYVQPRHFGSLLVELPVVQQNFFSYFGSLINALLRFMPSNVDYYIPLTTILENNAFLVPINSRKSQSSETECIANAPAVSLGIPC